MHLNFAKNVPQLFHELMRESCHFSRPSIVEIGVEYQIIFVVVKCILVTFKIWKTLGDFITKTAEQKNVNKQFKIRRKY